MESLDGKPPSYTIQKEKLGNQKLWIVRSRGKLITVFRTKGDAQGWVFDKERRCY